jgi:cytochrome c6
MLCRVAKACVLLLMSTGIVAGCSKDETRMPATAPPASAAGSRVSAPDGEALFRQYCASCHPDGGNVSDPERTLHGSALKKKHITTPDHVVRVMRRPLSRMIRFDVATLPDRDAQAIAEYVLKTFN